MLEHFSITLAINKSKRGASTPDIIAVGGAISVMPVPILIFDCLVQLSNASTRWRILIEKRLANHPCKLTVAFTGQVNPVEGILLSASRKKLESRRIEVNECRIGLLSCTSSRFGVGSKVGIQLRALR